MYKLLIVNPFTILDSGISVIIIDVHFCMNILLFRYRKLLRETRDSLTLFY